jgi:hypothetical protein
MPEQNYLKELTVKVKKDVKVMKVITNYQKDPKVSRDCLLGLMILWLNGEATVPLVHELVKQDKKKNKKQFTKSNEKDFKLKL